MFLPPTAPSHGHWTPPDTAFTQPSCCVHAQLLQSCLTLCNPMDCTCQAPLSMAFSRQEYWSELPCLPSGDLSNPGIEPASLALLHRWILPEPLGKPDPPFTGAQKSLLLARTPTIFPPWPHLSVCYCYFSFCQSTALTILQAPFLKNLKGSPPVTNFRARGVSESDMT